MSKPMMDAPCSSLGESWLDRPLGADEWRCVREHFRLDAAKPGESVTCANDALRRLRLPQGVPVILFLVECIGHSRTPMLPDELQILQDLIAISQERGAALVIRLHPLDADLTGGLCASRRIKAMAELALEFPGHVRVISSGEEIGKLALLDLADAVVAADPATAILAGLRGAGSLYFVGEADYVPGLRVVTDRADLGKLISQALADTATFDLKDVRRAWRLAHARMSVDCTQGACKVTAMSAEAEELRLALGELEAIRRNRARCTWEQGGAEPLISVVRVRRSGVRGFKGSLLARSLERSRHKNIERVEAPYLAEDGPEDLLRVLEDVVRRCRGEIVHVACEDVLIDEAFLATCADLMVADGAVEAIMGGAYLCSSSGDIQDEILTSRNPLNGADGMLAASSLFTSPVWILTLCAFRRESLLRLIRSLLQERGFGSAAELSRAIGNELWAMDASRLRRLGQPLLMACEEPTDEQVTAQGEGLMLRGQHGAAVAILNRLKLKGCRSPRLQYLRALAQAKQGKIIEAFQAARSAMRLKRPFPEAVQLTEALQSALAGNAFQYAHVAAAIDQVEGYLSPNQERYLFETVRALPHNARILEVGCYYGRSTACMAFACIGTERRIVSIDTFCGNDGPMGRSEDFFDVWRGNLSQFDIEEYASGLRGYSHEVLPGLNPEQQFDFAFIDASHEYPDVLRDFRLVYPLVKDGGRIAFHDVEIGWPGSWRVWRQAGRRLLSDHEYCDSLACGRKQAGVAFRDFADSGYCYGEDWAAHLGELRIGQLQPLVRAMTLTSRLFRMDGGSSRPLEHRLLDSLEECIASMPQMLRSQLTIMLQKEAAESGVLRYWNALIQAKEGKAALAADELAVAASSCPGQFVERLRLLEMRCR